MRMTRRLVLGVLATASIGVATARAQTLRAGGFSRQVRRISGTWSIVREAGGVFLVLSEDFRTRAAPDLKFFLHPLPAAQVTAQNAAQGRLIGALPSARGAQRIAVPDGVDLTRFRSLVLHCEQFTALWGAGDL